MSKIKVNIRYDFYNKRSFWKNFTIEPYTYKVGDTYDNEEIKKVEEISPDIENNSDVWEYEYYLLVTTENREYDIENDVYCTYYIAVHKDDIKEK